MAPMTTETGTTFAHAITYEKRNGKVVPTTICGEPPVFAEAITEQMIFCPMCREKMRQGAVTVPIGLAALLPECERTPEIVVPKHFLS